MPWSLFQGICLMTSWKKWALCLCLYLTHTPLGKSLNSELQIKIGTAGVSTQNKREKRLLSILLNQAKSNPKQFWLCDTIRTILVAPLHGTDRSTFHHFAFWGQFAYKFASALGKLHDKLLKCIQSKELLEYVQILKINFSEEAKQNWVDPNVKYCSSELMKVRDGSILF